MFVITLYGPSLGQPLPLGHSFGALWTPPGSQSPGKTPASLTTRFVGVAGELGGLGFVVRPPTLEHENDYVQLLFGPQDSAALSVFPLICGISSKRV